MSTTDEEGVRSIGAFQDERVVDAEFHVPITAPSVYEYVDDPEAREWFEELGPPLPATSGWWEPYANEEMPGYSFMEELLSVPSAEERITSEDVRETMAEIGLDAVVVNPPDDFPLVDSRTPKMMNQVARAYNDYVLDRIVDPSEGIYAAMILPFWDPPFAEAEVERIGSKEGIVAGVNWLTLDRPFGVIEYDGVLEKLAGHDLALLLHRGPSSEFYHTMDRNLQTMAENKMTTENKTMLGTVMNMIYTGVFDTHTDLEVVIQGFGGMWIPFAADRGDEIYQVNSGDYQLTNRMYDGEYDYLPRRPSEYVHDNFYVTNCSIGLPPSDEMLEHALKVTYADQTFMYSTNWPDGEVDGAEWLDRPAIDAETRAAILHGNAEDVFGI